MPVVCWLHCIKVEFCQNTILPDTQEHAEAAVKKVAVSYSDVRPPVTDIRDAIRKKSFFPAPSDDFIAGNAEGEFIYRTGS